MTAQAARAKQAHDIVELWIADGRPKTESVLRVLTEYSINPQALHLTAHLVTACREAGLI